MVRPWPYQPYQLLRPCNFGERGYSDTRGGGGWTSMDCPGWSGYPRCTGIHRHRGGGGWMSLDWQDGLGILGVRGYTDIGVGDGWTSVDCPGWSGYTRTQLQGHPRNVICVGHGCLDFLGLSRIVFVCGGSCLCNLHIHSELGIVHGTW